MLLQNLDINTDPNMTTSRDDYESKSFAFDGNSKQISDIAISPLLGPFSTSSDKRSIPALPNLNAPSSSTSWSSSTSGMYSLFSSSISNSSLAEKPVQQNLKPHLNNVYGQHGLSNSQPQSQNFNIHRQSVNKSGYHGVMPHPSMEMQHTTQVHQVSRSADPLENMLGPFPCARLRGLPFDFGIGDVLALFPQLLIIDAVMIPPPYVQQGAIAEAFVLFANPMDLEMALRRNPISVGHQLVEVTQGKRPDYYAAVSMLQRHYNLQSVNELGKGEVNLETLQGGVWSPPGDHASQPQVLRNPHMQDINKNMQKPHGGGHHPGYAKGIASSGGRAGRGGGDIIRPGKQGGRGNTRGGGIRDGEHTGFLRMRGLPFTATKGEIYEFFKKYDPIQESICLTYRSDGRATGEGYIAFQKPDDAKEAMCLHRNTMGNRYIELFISNKEEHGRALAREASSALR